METQIIATVGAIVALLLFSAFFSGSETALTAASRPRIHNLEQSGDERARIVNRLLDAKGNLIGAILLGNNLVNILSSALATSILISLFGEAGVVYATIAMTLLVLIFAEVLPKTYAIHNADRMALAVAPVLRLVVQVLGPITHAIQAIVHATLKLFRVDTSIDLSADISEEELRGAIEFHTKDEEQEERKMLRSILDLADVEVEEIMVHRRDVVAIDIDLPPAQIVEEVLASPYTRIPLWQGDPDNVVGVLHAKALLRAVHSDAGNADRLEIRDLANPPWFIPENTTLLAQLQAFRRRHEHFAIVVDEYGVLLGIVTLEDILEEIVGEIADEHDIEIEGVQPQRDGSVIVDGKVTIRDLNRRNEWRLPDEEASTIAGLVLHEARRIPEVGQAFVFHGFSFEILARRRHQITSLRIKPLTESTVEEGDTEDGAAN